MSNTSIHTLTTGQHLHHLHSLSSITSPSLSRSHSPSLPPTHAHPRCSTSTCNLELHFPFLLSPISPSHNPSRSLSSIWLSHAYMCVHPEDQIPIWTELAAQPSSPPPPPRPLSFFLLSAIQIKNTLHCLDRAETCAAWTEHYVIIWDSPMRLTLTDGQTPKHAQLWNFSMLF